jgi:hypothetical protein
MIIPGFDKSFLNIWNLFREEDVDDFIAQTQAIENNLTLEEQLLKQGAINFCCFEIKSKYC